MSNSRTMGQIITGNCHIAEHCKIDPDASYSIYSIKHKCYIFMGKKKRKRKSAKFFCKKKRFQRFKINGIRNVLKTANPDYSQSSMIYALSALKHGKHRRAYNLNFLSFRTIGFN